MKKILSKIGIETILGGFFSVLAILAIVIEMYLGGFSAEVVASGAKDIAGTIVAVFVLVASWLAIRPKNDRNFVFDNVLDERLEEWQKSHKNMICIKNDNRDLYMKTDVSNFFGAGSNKDGRFVKIDVSDKLVLSFSLNRGLIVGHGVDNEIAKTQISAVGEMIHRYCSNCYSEMAEVKYIPSQTNIIVTLNGQSKSKKDVDLIMDMLEKMYQAFLVCASVRA